MTIGWNPIYLDGGLVRNLSGDLPCDTEASETRPARYRVLIVDDEKLVADTCTKILEGAGFDVRTAYDGRTALEMVTSFQPDCLLTDILMPGLNGVQLAIAVRKLMPATQILLFSGQVGISNILLEGYGQGYEFELIAKPIHPVKLIACLQKQ